MHNSRINLLKNLVLDDLNKIDASKNEMLKTYKEKLNSKSIDYNTYNDDRMENNLTLKFKQSVKKEKLKKSFRDKYISNKSIDVKKLNDGVEDLKNDKKAKSDDEDESVNIKPSANANNGLKKISNENPFATQFNSKSTNTS